MDRMQIKSLPRPTNIPRRSIWSHLPLTQSYIAPEHTISTPISCCGIGLHSGKYINLKLLPAPAGTGVIFRRTDMSNISIRACYDNVVDTTLSTVIANPKNPSIKIATIEHLMAALSGNQIDNIIVECDGPELPVLDGSSAQFNALLEQAGRQTLLAIIPSIKILKTVRVESKDAFAELVPSTYEGLTLTLSIDFPVAAIGKQIFKMHLTPENFKNELAHCRTFTLKSEIDTLHKMGLAKGGSLDNAIVVEDDIILNPNGLRCKNEFVKHKMLDAIGDLALSNVRIHGEFIGHKSGHKLNNLLLRKLMSDKEAWCYLPTSTTRAASPEIFPNFFYKKQEKQEA
ncbi:UDP-3-O-acyl-N-acetylglucosamine deacetylase [Commensalibacter papalotli (ex Servin-Garciduenas et al. 2014)]|uniref:UDP-3-O-acyl-N-acetylglucosamine deacetylase n=1 Tax=Commensalibacter papalotli (ex Servin-Garciduenas et al. 2014) TaxID=1208583 RepID=W7E4T1_9PROT|nr:UDP-3-O-acyl-N-acetylglucosamine deacetylase [Commensalibacter papalotli (ex Servin-Garciduenas et al. 2014)]EUK18091.1 UDP-3-O-[3-hydroxymyristoyl] N-acetylglucosamine deacetylase [Commensalibacter papalotli (ex Servin-Garciduenas et al. 2014)]